jgi:hypothetical protein
VRLVRNSLGSIVKLCSSHISSQRPRGRIARASISPLNRCALSCCVAIASCAGPWAQATHVLIKPLPGSKLYAQADVIEATTCGAADRCQPQEGSTIILTVTRAEPRATYEATLATGSCQRPTDQPVIARQTAVQSLQARDDARNPTCFIGFPHASRIGAFRRGPQN